MYQWLRGVGLDDLQRRSSNPNPNPYSIEDSVNYTRLTFLLDKPTLCNELCPWFCGVTSLENAESILLPEKRCFNDCCHFDMIIVGGCVRLDPRYFLCKGIMAF